MSSFFVRKTIALTKSQEVSSYVKNTDCGQSLVRDQGSFSDNVIHVVVVVGVGVGDDDGVIDDGGESESRVSPHSEK